VSEQENANNATPEDIESFDQLDISEETLQSIKEAGYEEPTPVQAKAIPLIMSGTEVAAQAQTGTGKTAAFTIPLIEILDPDGPPAQALILAPTRELAKQVQREFETLGKGRKIRSFTVYGGVGFEPQEKALKRDHVIVATPGRMLDHLRKGNVDISNLKYFVLDEADEMLSMGFEKEVTDIIRKLPAERRNLLFSATMPQSVVNFAENFIRDAKRLDLSSDSVAAISVHHVYFKIKESERVAALRSLLRSRTVTGAIIFANTKVETFRVKKILEEERYSVGVLNGDLPQKQREKVLKQLREESLDFLVATDIAARGIDISWLRSVINYDMPDQPEAYIHRTGRTGRAGLVGTAYSLVTPGDISVFHHLHKFYDLKMEERELPSREDIFRAQTDRAIEEWLGPVLEADNISYGQYLSLARRLGESSSGVRTIAKLIALYRDSDTVVASTSDAASSSADKEESDEKEDSSAKDKKEQKPSRSDSKSGDDDDAGDSKDTGSPYDGSLPTSDEIRTWIYENSKGRNRWRSVKAIGEAFGISQDEVDRICTGHRRLKRTTGKRQMWKVLKPYPPEEAEERLPDSSSIELGPPTSYTKLQINVGKNLVNSPSELVNTMAQMAGFDHEDIGKADVKGNHSIVEVSDAYWRDFIDALQNETWKGKRLRLRKY
jgi:ATP-dependent RNA helicase DeaD